MNQLEHDGLNGRADILHIYFVYVFSCNFSLYICLFHQGIGRQLRPLIVWKGDVVNYARSWFFNQEIDDMRDKVGDAINCVLHCFIRYNSMCVEYNVRKLLGAVVFTASNSMDIHNILVSINVHCSHVVCVTQYKTRSERNIGNCRFWCRRQGLFWFDHVMMGMKRRVIVYTADARGSAELGWFVWIDGCNRIVYMKHWLIVR